MLEVRSRDVERRAGLKSGGGKDPQAPLKGTHWKMGTGGSGGDGACCHPRFTRAPQTAGALWFVSSLPADLTFARNAHPVTGDVRGYKRNSEFTSNPVSVVGRQHVTGACVQMPTRFQWTFPPHILPSFQDGEGERVAPESV